ncbi:MAG: NAD(P)/FAD-dependent oxidoreductase [Treponema sp.]|nr:NAD(P)/FAD-dependent oxidoreductase [Treponema sp.]
MEKLYDVIVIGGGPAGLAAAISAVENGAKNTLILERDARLGGILLQCIHNGFGLHYFGEELTGPEYAARFSNKVEEMGIEYKVNTMVLSVEDGEMKTVSAINSIDGLMNLKTKSVVISTGCRERTRGALVIPGTRPAGIFTAGSAQRFVNIDGYLPGKKVVILGSGDIGLIMARRMTLEGAEVKMVCEVMDFSAGLQRNITQCLDNFNIPLHLSTTVVKIHGKDRVTGVTIAKVDDHRKPIQGTEKYVECDTLLLSVGLIPENEIANAAHISMDPVTKGPYVNQMMETNVPGIFACGNSVHVHDLVDFVTQSSTIAGKYAALYAQNADSVKEEKQIAIMPGNRVRYTVPQHISVPFDDKTDIMFRVTDSYKNVTIKVYDGSKVLASKRKMVVRPGEMQTIELKTPVSEITGPVTVSCEMEGDSID